MVKIRSTNSEGSDFDSDELSVDGNPIKSSTEKLHVDDDQLGRFSAKAAEFHDDPRNPRPLKKAFMESLELSGRDFSLFAAGFTAVQVVGMLCIFIVLAWVEKYLGGFAWSSNPAQQFNYHPLFMVIGMIYLYGNAILVYRALRYRRKIILKIFHAFLHLLAFVFIVMGLKAVFDFHNAKNIPNLYTLHSWMGLTTVICFALQYVLGFVSFLLPGFTKNRRICFLPIHVFSGLAIFISAAGCCITGITAKLIWTLKTDYGQLASPAILVNSLGLLIVLFALLVLILALSPRFKRQPLLEETDMEIELKSSPY